MINPVYEAKSELNELIMAALGRCVADGALPNEAIPPFVTEIPSDSKNGDFAANIAMVSAKAFRLPPRKIAEAIVSALEIEGSCFKSAEIAGPGFINFFLAPEWFEKVVKSVHELEENYGKTDFGKGRRILVEFVSANPTGPMHIGNARGGALGDSLAAILEWSGHYVEKEFYVNDAGNQINKFGASLEARYMQIYNPDYPMIEEGYLGEDIIAHAKNFANENGDKYVSASEEDRRAALVSYALPINIAGLESDLKRYRIVYDNWFRESTLHNDGSVDKIVEMFKEKGCTYEQDGALWFKATDYGADADFVLLRSNGVPTYVVPDIVYHYNKLVSRGFDKAVDVLGADHHGYIPRLKASLKALNVNPDRLDVVLMQMVRLVRDGEIVKASKRSGKAITLATLLDEIPIDAARFFFNLRESTTQMDFDLDLATEETSQNPVYYVQYAHARICSILKNLLSEGIAAKPINECDLSLLCANEEIELIRHIAGLPAEIIDAAKSYDPSRAVKYSIELATLFHKFYNSCRVKCDDLNLMQARIALCSAVRTTLANTLTMLKVSAPESM